MATMKELYQQMESCALRASRNLHKDFVRYLCGLITFEEFIRICKTREVQFEAEMRGGE